MTTEVACPECDGQLQHEHDHWLCGACHHKFSQRVHCDKCDAELEKLKACGAVDYFCNSCNELKSKRAVIRRFERLDS
ncbi:zinc ribbon domain-containing protein [Agarivorans litoreus]|uniref:zinc ribbon domain-containing protein n=1 Tax=Agarivorans litoreus TaxID=1510455 RepID=UPI001C7DAB52|nr:zinc ribbon domain-containing protein [Agarivorans litoreus]